MARPVDKQRTICGKLRRNIVWFRVIVAAIVVVASWIPLFGWFFFDFDFLKGAIGTPLQRYAFVGALITLIAPLVAWYDIKKSLFLAEYGVVVDGKVTQIGFLKKNGMVRMDYAYDFSGRTYKKAESVATDTADNYPEGSKIQILVDPSRPKNSKWRIHVLPDSAVN